MRTRRHCATAILCVLTAWAHASPKDHPCMPQSGSPAPIPLTDETPLVGRDQYVATVIPAPRGETPSISSVLNYVTRSRDTSKGGRETVALPDEEPADLLSPDVRPREGNRDAGVAAIHLARNGEASSPGPTLFLDEGRSMRDRRNGASKQGSNLEIELAKAFTNDTVDMSIFMLSSVQSGTIQRAAAKLPPGSNGKQIAVNLGGQDACNVQSVTAYEEAEGTFSFGALYAEYGSATEAERNVDGFHEAIKATEAVLVGCYRILGAADFANPETFAGHHHLGARLGSLAVGKNPMCTALLVGNGSRILTARHCFTDVGDANLADMWFQTAIGTDRFQVCAISEAHALANGAGNVADDQVIARIQQGLPPPARTEMLDKGKLRVLSDASFEAPDITLLANFSFMPAAKLLHPESSGFVTTKAPVCAAISHQTGCFTDLCRAVHGGSGSAIFDATHPDEPALTLVGTHVAGAATVPGCTLTTPDANTSAYVREALRSAIQEP